MRQIPLLINVVRRVRWHNRRSSSLALSLSLCPSVLTLDLKLVALSSFPLGRDPVTERGSKNQRPATVR